MNISQTPLPTITLSTDVKIKNEEVTKLDIKPLDIFPANYEEILSNNKITLTNHQRTSLLRDGFVRFTPDSGITEISIPEETLQDAYNSNVEEINRELLNSDLKNLLNEYLDKLLSQSNKESLVNADYKALLDSININLTSVKNGLNIDLESSILSLHGSPKELGVIVYLTKKTKLQDEFSKIYSLSNYLDLTLSDFNLYETDKYIIDNKIDTIRKLLANSFGNEKPLESVKTDTKVRDKVSNTALTPDETCLNTYKDLTFNIITSDEFNIKYLSKVKNFENNITNLEVNIENTYTSSVINLSNKNTLLLNYICSQAATSIQMALFPTSTDGNLTVGYLSENYVQSVVSDENFNEPYDVEPTGQSKGSSRVPILMYHQIVEAPSGLSSFGRNLYVSPLNFEKHLAYLVKKNYKTISPKEMYELLVKGGNPTQKSIILTFDDGVKNHYTNAYRLLKKYGLSGVFYVPSNKRQLTPSEMKEMADNEMFVDSHSKTHMDLQKQKDYSSLYDEIHTSKVNIEAMTEKEVQSLAYPYCVANSTAISLVASSGYYIATSCGTSIDHYRNNRLTLSRMHANEDTEEFKRLLSGKR